MTVVVVADGSPTMALVDGPGIAFEMMVELVAARWAAAIVIDADGMLGVIAAVTTMIDAVCWPLAVVLNVNGSLHCAELASFSNTSSKL